ncbi:bifunctional 2-C-methyl-D-erythritol 4-phosphate cytidylyltransferase/2-C-methyl-D-erythritol 2,4-cyclodiphosphate synthase [Altericroceibacterium endophyticum]|uniref:Bifunctional enzyme IspD/IspF n=1 Tax=Altericroceibacterium endophyticum TaxID=1808508 RepID=A0A6I4T2T2_9SPHN|nr:bifunctional 2-C-methyl-D-erythritol 4-phosphate cytidylyltransferase/2-C-methyl-D-erythritol 2,4-cyclodiphosphate synthase [Altericroceibacterium endophyticum]MXO64531.1 bifunctional 2-C-methyl-D-erythritol 4-phosphate cytidylyltransferase/2-C-methyl-D-erythritol 2,4-cyclodiphosphate synthase [Altericroceibacterium endophyticum]
MTEPKTPLPGFAAIIVAAGKGLRAGHALPKQFVEWRGKPVLRHSAESLRDAGASPLIVVIPAGAQDVAAQALDGLSDIEFIIGGATRQESVFAALNYLSNRSCDRVLIHDAARPILPHAVVQRLMAALETDAGAIPVLPVVDSLAQAEGHRMVGTAQRDKLKRVQTPQAFRFTDIYNAHQAWDGAADAGDDAQILHAAGGLVALVEGDEALKKLTFAEDFMPARMPIRIGSGFDVHRLVDQEELWLGGIKIEHHQGLSGHSDADVVLHAVVDAILGGVAKGDIGQHFPPSDPRWKGARSSQFVEHAVSLAAEAGYRVGNMDVTIMCEAPKIGPHRDAMREKLAELTSVDVSMVSVKATTTERLGFTGRGEGIAAQAVVTLTEV